MNTQNKARREVLLWLGLFLVSAVAAVVINVILEKVNQPLTTAPDPLSGAWEVNVREMFLAMLHENLILCLGIFAILGITRLVVLLASRRH